MRLSLSVRIAEGFLSKEVPILPLRDVTQIAATAGYDAICMRASQIGIHSSSDEVKAASDLLQEHGLAVSMVTGDFDTVYNNDDGPSALRNIEPYVDLARQLRAPLIRVALKQESDITAARQAAAIAADGGVKLVHQCHTLSLFETVDGIVQTLERIDHDHFGLIYEPANLELCGQSYTQCIDRLAPWILNVYFQNQRIQEEGAVTLQTWCRGPVDFDIIPIHEPEGIDFASVVDGLKRAGYDGTVTVHQSAGDGEKPLASATSTAQYLRSLMDRT